MTPAEWWKNFALGVEVDAAGSFIYNGIRALHELEILNYPVDTFEVLYNLSVGIERLLKVAIILEEHHDEIDINKFEESLISHSTIELASRLNLHRSLKISAIHKEFLSLLSKFYKSHRYGRYSFGVVPDIYEEKRLFLEFIAKHLQIDINIDDEFLAVPNSEKIKRFVGKTVKKICDEVFSAIRARASALNIYTDEIRGDAKALKVFYGERLDFIDEDIQKREIILFLMSQGANGVHKELLSPHKVLELDSNSIGSYIKALLNDANLSYAGGEIDELYTEIKKPGERIETLKSIDSEYR